MNTMNIYIEIRQKAYEDMKANGFTRVMCGNYLLEAELTDEDKTPFWNGSQKGVVVGKTVNKDGVTFLFFVDLGH